MTEYALPPKIIPALRRLRKHYEKKGENTLKKLIDAARIFVETGTEYDNWNGGLYGHDVVMYVPENMIELVDLDDQGELFERLAQDLNKATPEVQNEYVRVAYVVMADEADPNYQASVPFSSEPRADPKQVGLWKGNALRIFISHRDKHKKLASDLAEALVPYGISAFVAHHAIKPMKEWQKEILNGLMTMEIMLVLLTDDFHEGDWTNQEVGFALGKGIPIICVKVGSTDPKGFIGSQQALKVKYDQITKAASLIHQSLVKEIGQEGRLKEVLIEAFISSTCFTDTIKSLNRLTITANNLTDAEFRRIVKGYEENDQLHGCGAIHTRENRFKRYLEHATGKRLEFRDNKIIELVDDDFEDIPF